MRPYAILAMPLALGLAFATPSFALTTHDTTTSSSSTMSRTNSGHQAEQFKTEAEAKSACSGQQVVWANTSSHVLHAAGTQYYGKTKHGAYMCENTAMQSGYHMAKNDK